MRLIVYKPFWQIAGDERGPAATDRDEPSPCNRPSIAARCRRLFYRKPEGLTHQLDAKRKASLEDPSEIIAVSRRSRREG